MPKQITITVYEYKELEGRAKDRARNWWLEADFDWVDNVKEDAKETMKIKIAGYDIDRGAYCKIEFLEDALVTARAILQNHGEVCETWKIAKEHEAALVRVFEDVSAEDEAQEVIERFQKALAGAVLDMLRAEYDYRQSEEYVSEMMELNDYTFDENGRRQG